MFSSQSAEIALNAPCRALAAVEADPVESRFLLGTSGQHQDDETNQHYLHVVRFHSEVNELGVDAKMVHDKGPVADICCSPTDASLVLTTVAPGRGCASSSLSEATLWRIPRSVMTQSEGLQYDPEEDDALDAASSATMEEVLTLPNSNSAVPVVDMAWRDASEDYSGGGGGGGEVLTMDLNGQLTQWDLNASEGSVATSIRTVPTTASSDTSRPRTAGLVPRVAWDPHANGQAVAVTSGARVSILDWRADTSSIPLGMVESFGCGARGRRGSSAAAVTDLSYNPNKPYVLATSGQDGLVKFWDLRSARRPLLVARGGHSHWAQKVEYNPFHDQLVLSTGTDSVANLWRLSTISSAPLLTTNTGTADHDHNDDAASQLSETDAPNVRVARHEHADSIYQAVWSAADAWVYMVVSYDGKAVLNHVDSKEKYKILL